MYLGEFDGPLFTFPLYPLKAPLSLRRTPTIDLSLLEWVLVRDDDEVPGFGIRQIAELG